MFNLQIHRFVFNLYKVDENIIGTTKIQDNYGAIQLFNFPFDFSLLLLVKLSLLNIFTSF